MSKPTVLVTGAANGIGRGTAEVLSQRGWRVAVNDLDSDAVATVAQELGGIAVPGDVARNAATIVEHTIESTGRLDGLVNNAGIVRRQSLADITPENIDETIAVNLRAAMLLSAAALPHLERRTGAIVNIASFTVNHPVPHGGTYSTSKGALLTYTRQAAVEWGPRGVRVNAIGPGMIRTAMAESVYRDPAKYEARRRLVPLGRIGTPEDVGRVVAFLLSEDARYVSGQCIMVDGAQSWTLAAHIPSSG